MKTHTRFIANLKLKDKKLLNNLVKNSTSLSTRDRAKAILLSAQRKNVKELAGIFNKTTRTIYSWIDRWENNGINGLEDKDRSGAPSQLTDSEKEIVVKILKKHPHSPKLVLAEVSKRLGKEISEWILRHIAIAAGMSWKRMRKSLKKNGTRKHFSLLNKN